jgi:hypothetical protein
MVIPFGAWLPDMPPSMQGAATIANNVIPSEAGYRPLPSWVVSSHVLPGTCLGAASFISQAGAIYNFAGTTTKLYRLNPSDGLGWTDVSRAAVYAVPALGFWTFSQFGDVITAQNGIDTAQTMVLDQDSAFKDEPKIPIAQFAFTVRGFSGAAKYTLSNSTVGWSGIYAPTDFTVNPATLSDNQFMPDGGSITGAVGGEVGIIFQQRAISRMSFEGPPLAFRFDKISTTLGCRAPRSIAQYGDLTFFMAPNGMYMVSGGTQVVPIGDGKIDIWLQTNLDSSSMSKISAAISPRYKIYVMGFVSTKSEDGVPDTLLIYHWPTGKWATANFRHQFIYQGAVQIGYNLDTIDVLSTTGFPPGNIDSMDFSFDSDVFSPIPDYALAAFRNNNFLGYFNGSPSPATMETGDINFVPGRKAILMGVRPLIEAVNAPIKMSTLVRDRLQDIPSQGPNVPINVNGIVPQRINGRYHRMKVVIADLDDAGKEASWTHAIGLDEPKISPSAP